MELIYGFILVCIIGIAFAIAKFIKDFRRLKSIDVRCHELRAKVKIKRDLNAGIPIRLNRHTWAEFEGKIQNLKRVIVVADIVQQPDNSLLAAVIHNFGREVQYSFIVSKKNAEAELHGHLESFQALAMLAIKKHNLSKSVTDLVSIEALPDDWNCVPLVFYRIEDPGTVTGFKTLAFWGDKENTGIADTYEMLPPAVADALATALMSGAPQPVKEMISKLEQDNFQGAQLFLAENVPTKKVQTLTLDVRRN
ncbi:MAG TPA: hypothetical protein VG347_14660 [Verrucomicrobiae bacterium]|nr:hypothetical protein [Verrucomicrobiae bacterium]